MLSLLLSPVFEAIHDIGHNIRRLSDNDKEIRTSVPFECDAMLTANYDFIFCNRHISDTYKYSENHHA